MVTEVGNDEVRESIWFDCLVSVNKFAGQPSHGRNQCIHVLSHPRQHPSFNAEASNINSIQLPSHPIAALQLELFDTIHRYHGRLLHYCWPSGWIACGMSWILQLSGVLPPGALPSTAWEIQYRLLGGHRLTLLCSSLRWQLWVRPLWAHISV